MRSLPTRRWVRWPARRSSTPLFLMWTWPRRKAAASVVGGEALLARRLLATTLRPRSSRTRSRTCASTCEEVFGPVASTVRVKDYDEALAVANAGEFGLSAGIMTSSLKYARHFVRNVRAGMVMTNLPTAGVDYHVPFGGTRKSSFGPREQGFAAVEFYTQVKTSYTWA